MSLPISQLRADTDSHACWKCRKQHKNSAIKVVKKNDEKLYFCAMKCFEHYSEYMKSKIERDPNRRRSSTPLPFKAEFKEDE